MTATKTAPEAAIAVPEAAAFRPAKAIDNDVIATFRTNEETLGRLSVLFAEAKEAQIHLDPSITDANGNQFPSLGAYLADRLKGYPLTNKVLIEQVVDMLLDEGVSVRKIEDATGGIVKKSTVSNRRKAKQDAARAAAAPVVENENEGAVEGAAPAPVKDAQDVAGKSITPAQEAARAATGAVTALARVRKWVPDMSAADIQKVLLAIEEASPDLAAMLAMLTSEQPAA